QPIIARLSDPSSLLLRPRPRPPVNQVIATVAARKNIPLHSLDFSAALNSVQSNGPILATTKRPRSSSPNWNDSGRRNGTELDATELVNGTGGQDSASPPPCKKQAIGVGVKCSNLTETSNGLLMEDGTDDKVSGQPSAVNARYPDGIGLPVALAGGSRGTQCFKTPSVIRLARILCPDLIRPLLLARRPARHASSTGSKTLSMDTSSQAENALSLNDLKTAGEILCFPTFC
ncbi:uncharacterized protein DEA37_0009014, partial [Paragonimus westermani]